MAGAAQWGGSDAPVPGGLTTFVQMQTDAQVRACLTTKRLSVLSGDIIVTPADTSAEAQHAAQMVEQAVQNALGGWAFIVTGALDALAMGLAIGEILWDDTTLCSVVWHDPRRFAFHCGEYGGHEIALVEELESGQKWQASRFILWAYQGKWSSPLGESDLRAAYLPWERKCALQAMWVSALDRFGAPTPIARVPVNWQEADTERLAKQLGSLQNESAFVLPVDVELTTLSAMHGTNEPGAAFLAAVDFENREIARAILGQELTTHSGGLNGTGSQALGKVHGDVLENWVRAVRLALSEAVLTAQIARPLCAYLLGDAAPVPRVGWADNTTASVENSASEKEQAL